VIGQAKGILMERESLDDAEAFQMLTTISQRLNIKLRQVSVLLIQQTEDDQSDGG
jgi:AmiR/NasT family two-component response regulator